MRGDIRSTCAIAVFAGVLGHSSLLVGQDAMTCPDIGSLTLAVKQKYETALKQLSDEGQQLNDGAQRPSDVGAAIGFDFDVKMNEQKWVFDLPSVTMRNQRIVFDVPEVTMKDQRIVFDTPSTRMKNVKCGQYPEFHGFTVRWRDIICSVPEVFMQRHEIIMGIPETRMGRQEVVLGVPEFRMERQEWFVKIPEFTLKNVRVETQKLKDRGESLKARGASLALSMKQEMTASISTGFACYKNRVSVMRAEIAAKMDDAISQMTRSIDQLRSAGGNPESAGGAPPVNLVQKRNEMVAQRSVELAKIDATLALLLAQEKEAIDKLNTPMN